MKLHIDGVETEVPGVEIDNGMSLYVDHAGVVRATRTVPPVKSDEDLTPADRQAQRIADLERQLAAAQAPPPPPSEDEN